MKATKILNNLIALNKQSGISYDHPILVKVNGEMHRLKERVSIEFINDTPCYVLDTEEPNHPQLDPNMTKQEIINSCTQGIAEDVNGNIYQLYDANNLYEITRKGVIEEACALLAKGIDTINIFGGCDKEKSIESFRKRLEE